MAATPTIQTGQITLAASGTSVTVDRGVDSGFDTTVTTTQTILLWTARSADTSGSFGTVRGRLTDGDTITFDRNNTTTADCIIEWQLISFATGVVVQHKTITVGAGSASGTVAIDAASIGGGRWLIHGGTYTSGTQNRDIQNRVIFDSTTQLSANRTTTTSQLDIAVQVVEHDEATVQTITFSRTATTATTEDETISAVTLANTAVFGSAQQSVSYTPDGWKYDLSFTSTTNLRLSRITGTSTNLTATCYVVSFADGTTVQHVANVHSGATTQDTTISAVVLARTAVTQLDVATGMTFSNVTTASTMQRGCGTRDLTSTTNLRTEKGTLTTNVTFNSQVIEFAEGVSGPVIDSQPVARTVVLNNDARTSATFQCSAVDDITDAAWDLEESVGGGTYAEITDGGIYDVSFSENPPVATLVITPVNTDLSGLRVRARLTDAGGETTSDAVALTVYDGPILSAYSGTTNASGVKTTDLTSDIAGTRILTRAYYNGTEVGRTTTLPG